MMKIQKHLWINEAQDKKLNELGRDFRLPTVSSSRHLLLRKPSSVMLRGAAVA